MLVKLELIHNSYSHFHDHIMKVASKSCSVLIQSRTQLFSLNYRTTPYCKKRVATHPTHKSTKLYWTNMHKEAICFPPSSLVHGPSSAWACALIQHWLLDPFLDIHSVGKSQLVALRVIGYSFT